MIKKGTRLIYLFLVILIVAFFVYVYIVSQSEPNFYESLPILISFMILACFAILISEIVGPRENLERWIFEGLQNKWKFEEYFEVWLGPSNKLGNILIFLPIIYVILIPIALLLLTFWIYCEGDLPKFSEEVYNFMSIILIFIFTTQTWIFYQQYHFLQQPPHEPTLIWPASQLGGSKNYCIVLKNGGQAPLFNIFYRISEVSVRDSWKFFKKRVDTSLSSGSLAIVDGGSEMKIFETSPEEFVKMRLILALRAKALMGSSIRLIFYKEVDKNEFRLMRVKYTR